MSPRHVFHDTCILAYPMSLGVLDFFDTLMRSCIFILPLRSSTLCFCHAFYAILALAVETFLRLFIFNVVSMSFGRRWFYDISICKDPSLIWLTIEYILQMHDYELHKSLLLSTYLYSKWAYDPLEWKENHIFSDLFLFWIPLCSFPLFFGWPPLSHPNITLVFFFGPPTDKSDNNQKTQISTHASSSFTHLLSTSKYLQVQWLYINKQTRSWYFQAFYFVIEPNW